jgi:CRISPR-associated endonuclease/helicase Cas3
VGFLLVGARARVGAVSAEGGAAAPHEALWGKSNAGGTVHLLLAHLLDAAAVGEVMWDEFMSPALRQRIDLIQPGHGRSVFALLCGWHDVGKASPAFQSKVEVLAQPVKAAGLTWPHPAQEYRTWHHTLAGARILRTVLGERGVSRSTIDWLWPMIAGHHGVVPPVGKLDDPPGLGHAHGKGPAWEQAQKAVVRRVANELEVDLSLLREVRRPRRAVQLAMLGAVIMADWIASDDHHFSGIDTAAAVTMAEARSRARTAWGDLRLRGGWDPARLPTSDDPVRERFGFTARGVQAAVLDSANEMAVPGLVIVEAPMGEGKTEAALAAVEVLSRRFGTDGVFLGMPTQATSDPMFLRLARWVRSVDPGVPVGLLHGKRRFNKDWAEATAAVHVCGVDEFGLADSYGSSPSGPGRGGARPQIIAPAQWLLGQKRGLLAPVTVGTVDQLLHAATRTRHVMLRHFGLAGGVVVLDEVHAYDVYMSQFLFEGLRWLADAGVPVILLSATLPPALREDLVRAYVQGARQQRDVDLTALPPAAGYPSVTSALVDKGELVAAVRTAPPWRASARVEVQVVPERALGENVIDVADLLQRRLAGGGCALVIRNTVGRAQETYRVLRERFGADAVLLHARLTVGTRAERTERVLGLLGKPGGAGPDRPGRLVVVATQLAEQSFDVDVDLLVTDLAPIDLLLQRIGRLHRHQRTPGSRPPSVRAPAVVVTGLAGGQDGPPTFPRGSSFVYGDHLLLRSAALVQHAAEGAGWDVPAQVPELVAQGYAAAGGRLPPAWSEAGEIAAQERDRTQRERSENARQFLLSPDGAVGAPTLKGLHSRSTSDLDEEQVAAVVRDGEPSVEVVLIRGGEDGYRTLGGSPLGVGGEAVSDHELLEQVMADTVRLPASPEITAAARQELRPLPGWGLDPWLSSTRALTLGPDSGASLGGHRLTYDFDLGLIDERER